MVLPFGELTFGGMTFSETPGNHVVYNVNAVPVRSSNILTLGMVFPLEMTTECSTSESIHICPAVLLDLKSGGTRRKFGEVTFESPHPIYMRSRSGSSY